MNRREFIKNSVIFGGGFAAGLGIRYFIPKNNIEKISYFDKKFQGLDILTNIDIHIVEHCNLNCKYCGAMSCIADEEYLDVDMYAKDIKQLAKVSEQRIKHIFLMGGEPLLHPQINKICEITRKNFPLANIDVFTNRLLLNSMPDSFWQTLHNNNVGIMQSIYNIKIANPEAHYKKAKKFGVLINPPYEETKHPIELFGVTDLVFEGNVDYKTRFEACNNCMKSDWACGQLYKGRLYQCCNQQGIQHFNKKFNQNIQLTEEDTLDIYKIKNYNDIMEYKYKAPKFCRFCGFGGVKKTWECSKDHDIHEWTYNA